MRSAWLLLIFALPGLSQQQPIRGFPPDDWTAQHEREEKAKAIPQPARIHIYMQRIASKPHARRLARHPKPSPITWRRSSGTGIWTCTPKSLKRCFPTPPCAFSK